MDVISRPVQMPGVQVIDRYEVGQARVAITKDGRYIVEEPPMTVQGEKIYGQMLKYLYQSLAPLKGSADPVKYIEDSIWKRARATGQTGAIKECYKSLRYRLERDVLRYGLLDVPMQDGQVEDITCERHDTDIGIIHRRHKSWSHPVLDSNISFGTREAMNAFIQSVMLRNHKTVSDARPFGNLRLPEGHRFHATYDNKVSLPGPTISVRKFTRRPMTISDMIRNGTMTSLQAAYFWMMIDARAFGMIIGPTGAGKTTVLNSLMFLCHPRWIIVTAEDMPELRIPHKRWKRLITREDYGNEKFAIGLQRLNYEALRMHPHFVVLGEVRSGPEVHSLFDIASTGHGGLATFHAEDPAYARMRLTDREIGLGKNQLVLLWFFVHLGEVRQGAEIVRRVLQIEEIVPGPGGPQAESLFRYDPASGAYDTNDAGTLVQKSRRVCSVAEKFGVDAREDLLARQRALERCAGQDACSAEDVIGAVSGHYGQKFGP